MVRHRPLALGFGLAGVVSIGFAFAASGHASVASPRVLTAPAVVVHALGVALWIGSLLPLAAAMKRPGSRALSALGRFSRAVPIAVAAVAVSGAVLAVILVEQLEALWSTDYGRVLVAKLALVTLVLGIAAWNRFVLTHRINRGQFAAARGLVRAIVTELVLVAMVFALVATWRFTPPPRSLAAAAAEPVVLSFHTASAFANIAFTPGRAGRVTVSMIVMTGNLQLLDAKAVTITLANPAAGVEPMARLAYKPGDGSWRIDAFTIPLPGLWSARVDVLMLDSTTVTLEGQIEIRP